MNYTQYTNTSYVKVKNNISFIHYVYIFHNYLYTIQLNPIKLVFNTFRKTGYKKGLVIRDL